MIKMKGRRTTGQSLTRENAGPRENATRKGGGRLTADVVICKNVIINGIKRGKRTNLGDSAPLVREKNDHEETTGNFVLENRDQEAAL